MAEYEWVAGVISPRNKWSYLGHPTYHWVTHLGPTENVPPCTTRQKKTNNLEGLSEA